MKIRPLIILAFTLAAGPLAAAQLYRWVDDKGRVEWRDTPPPADAKNVEQRTMGGNTIETSSIPYGVQQAMKKFPVTLWTFDCGEPCTSARNHLSRRGIPHSVRNAEKEPDALKKLTGGFEAPVLVVGTRTLKGYLDTDWDAALDSAGYPRTPMPGMKTQAEAKPQPAPKADSKAQPQATAPKAETPKPVARQP